MNGNINIYISVYWNIIDHTINILSDSGRPLRPLLIIQENKLLYNKEIEEGLRTKKVQWRDLVSKNISDKYYCIE